MIIQTIEEFACFLMEDRDLDNLLRLSFADNWEHLAKTNINTANLVAADHLLFDLTSDAFTEDVVYQIDEEVMKDFLAVRYGFTAAFVQNS